ncbi:MAG: PDZ domain-containing protein [Deltaproteobacteria bacterium]|nr:PDZ domain-containing protein [Deltaproteobacteria bacterium]
MKKSRRWFVLVIIILLNLSIPLWAKEKKEPLKLLSETTFLLPAKGDIEVKWLIPPLEEEVVKQAGWYGLIFSVDEKGHPWFGYRERFLLHPFKQYQFSLSHPFRGFVHLDNGSLLFATGTELGFIASAIEPSPKERGIPVATFQPLSLLPLPDSRIFKGSGNSLYFAGRNHATGDYEAYLLKPEKLESGSERSTLKGYVRLLSVEEPIHAVTGDGETFYMALGKLVIKTSRLDKTVSRLFLHPSEEIKELVYDPEAGLFYSTSASVGYIGENGNIELLKTPSPKISLQKGGLYVLFTKTMGVLAFENIGDLKRYPLAGGATPRYQISRKIEELGTKTRGEITLKEALKDRDVSAVKNLIVKGQNPNLLTDEGMPLLTWMVLYGGLEDVRWMLDRGTQVNLQDNHGNTALFEAGWIFVREKEEKVRLLLTRGAQVNGRNRYNDTPFLYAMKQRQSLEVVSLLLKNGAEVDGTDDLGDTALMKLAKWGEYRPEHIEFLLLNGANPHRKDKKGNSVLANTIQREPRPEYVRLLLKHGADVKTTAIDDRNGSGKSSSLLYSAFLTYLNYANSDRPKAHKAMEVVNLLIEKGSALLPIEESIVLKKEIYGWLDSHFIANLLKRNDSLFKQAKAISDLVMVSHVIQTMNEIIKMKMEQAKAADDFRSALSLANESKVLAEKFFKKLIIDVRIKERPTDFQSGASQKASKGYIGVEMRIWPSGGVYLVRILPQSPAEEAGIRTGDILTEFAGKLIKDVKDLPTLISGLEVGKSYKAVMLRSEESNWPEVFLHCGLLEHGLGMNDLAVSNLSKYLELAPDSNEKEKVRALVNKLTGGKR